MPLLAPRLLIWPFLSWRAMNFLVTGGAGFIGSHLCERLLCSGHAVWALDNLNDFYDPQLKRKNLHAIQALGKPFVFVQEDLLDRSALDALLNDVKFDQLIHLAARAGVRPSIDQTPLYQRLNVEVTVSLLESARLHGVQKATIASPSPLHALNRKVPYSEANAIVSPNPP